MPVTDLTTGHTEFVTNGTWFEPYEIMRAAKAIPFLYGGAVRLGGHSYIDGDVSVNMAELIRKARKEGATKILVITNTFKLSGAMRVFVLASAFFAKPMVRKLVLNDMRRPEWDHLPADVDILVIGPSYPLPLATITRIRRKVMEAYQMGAADLLAKEGAVRTLLGI